MHELNACIMGKAPELKWIFDGLFALVALTKSLVSVAFRNVGIPSQFNKSCQLILPILESTIPRRTRR
jgi:hypothetical protein